MKISFINSIGALAITGLSVSLFPATSPAHDFARGERHPAHHQRNCKTLPHGARCVSHRGERCWFAGGSYYRAHPLGGYVLVEQPTYETAVIEQPVIEREVVEKEVVVKRPVIKKKIVEEEVDEEPVVEEVQETVVEEPVLEEEDTVVEALPEGCEIVMIGGERCWLRDGVYYRHCNQGYKVCHPHGKGSKWHDHNGHTTKGHDHKDHGEHNPMSNHGNMGHEPHQTKNHGNMGNHMPHQTKNNGGMGMGHQGGKHDKHN